MHFYPIVFVVDDADRVIGWFNPRSAPALLAAAKGVDEKGKGNGFAVTCPVPEGWELREGWSLEGGHSKLRIPCGVVPAEWSEDDHDEGGDWDVLADRGHLRLRWLLTVTAAGAIRARPFVRSALVLPEYFFTPGRTLASFPPTAPDPVALAGIEGGLRPIPDAVREHLELRVELTDGVSWTEYYTGPFWDWSEAVPELASTLV
jgi:hypothetical protein